MTAAGYYEEGIDVADISHDQWDRMLAVILGGTANTFAAVLPHMLAAPEDIAGAVAFLAGPGASAMIGQVLQPNGGVTRTRA